MRTTAGERRWSTVVSAAAMLAAMAAGAAAQTIAPRDTHPRFADRGLRPAVGPGIVTQVGEVVVMEGDAEIVSALGGGQFGIEIGGQLANIGQRFYLTYPDQFDGLAIFTTFDDALQGGAAYSISAGWSGVDGLGLSGGNGAGAFGSSGKLISVINMNNTEGYGSMEIGDYWFATTFGQEFAHTWLAFMEFIDPLTSQRSSELLGRDGSHWSAVFDSGSSVMDGVTFEDLGGGRFRAGPYSTQYGPLDLYAMGVIGASEVGPLYLLRNARYEDTGDAVDPVNDGWTQQLSEGRVVLADPFAFSIDDIIAAHGPRSPDGQADNDDFRVAFILVTEPGQTAGEVAEATARLNVGRLTWEAKHREWTSNRSSMCTDVTAPCPLAIAAIDGAVVTEDPEDSDGDGILEPGEQLLVTATLSNPGSADATTATAVVTSESAGVVLPAETALPTIPAGGSIEHAFAVRIEGEACGGPVLLSIESKIEHRRWRGEASFTPGILPASDPERFATDAGWRADPDAADMVTYGAWEHGVPRTTFFAGRTLQPNGGAGGPSDAAWFTGPSDPWDQELVGTTTLESAPYDLSGQLAPTLIYKVWYLALDRTQSSLTPSADAHLIVEASSDGGSTWVEIDRVSGEPLRWATREASLAGKVSATAEVRLRFIATDPVGWEERFVEVGIDEVAFSSLSTSCELPGGGCCSAAEGGAPSLVLATLVLLLVGRRRRGRRPRPTAL